VAAGLAVLLAIVLGIAGTSAGLVRSMEAEGRAERRAVYLEEVVEFQESQLTELNSVQMGRGIRASILDRRREALKHTGTSDVEIAQRVEELDRALSGVNFTDIANDSLYKYIVEPSLEEINQRFEDQPLVQARLLISAGNALAQFGPGGLSKEPRMRAYEIRKRELGEENLDTMLALWENTYYPDVADVPEAEARQRRVLEYFRRELGNDDRRTIDAINGLGITLLLRPNVAEAQALFREAYERGRKALGEEDPSTLSAMGNFAILLKRSDPEESERLFRESLRLRRKVHGDLSRQVAWSCGRLAGVLRSQDRFDEAIPLIRESLEVWRVLRGEDHHRTIEAMVQLGSTLRRKGVLEDDAALVEEAERIQAEAIRRSSGHEQAVIDYYFSHAHTLEVLGRYEDAERRLQEAERLYEQNFTRHGITQTHYERGIALQYADLYERWEVAEPGAGHGAKSAAWREEAEARRGRRPDLTAESPPEPPD
jgi:tetratricopeptide (TPR) repeat protein